MQVFYALIAMLLLALLSLTLQRGTHSAERRQIVNEMTTQLVGVGIDVIEHIGRQPFDSQTDSNKVATVPPVTNAAQLTPKGSFGGCTDYNACEDVDDFDGLTITRDVGGLDFDVVIEINYVDENNPDVQPGFNTFAKEIRLSISSPHLYITKSIPLTVQIARVRAYDRATKV